MASEEAKQVLDELLRAFPDRADLKEQLRRCFARSCSFRRNGGCGNCGCETAPANTNSWQAISKKFPTEGVGGEILQGVREMTQDYDTREARRVEVVKQLPRLARRLHDTIVKENLKPILDEIAAEINQNTLDRMAAFLQNAADPQTPDNEKLALAVSGWVLGADAATPKLPEALAAYKVRGLIRRYLVATSLPDRERIYSYILEAGGSPAMAAELLRIRSRPSARPIPWPTSRATTRSK